MAKANSPRVTWDPAEYILHGQHCPTAIIRETLENAMHALGASKAVHIAFHDHGTIGSLSFTLGYPRLLGEQIDNLLAQAAYNGTGYGSLADDCLQAVTGLPGESTLNEESARKLADSIARLKVKKRGLADPEIRDFTESINSGMYLTHTGRASHLPTPGDIHSLLLLDITPVSKSLLRQAGLSHSLAVQLKATAEGSALSDTMVMGLIADRSHFDREPGAEPAFAETASHALNLVMEVTNSKAGAIYLLSASTKQPFEGLVVLGSVDFPARVDREDGGVLAAAVSQNIAVQRSTWPFLERSDSTSSHPAGASLVSPIGGPGIDPWRPAVGAIVLCRERQNDAFSAYDLALVRNVALRISLARTSYAMWRIGAVTSALGTSTDWESMIDRLKNDDLMGPRKSKRFVAPTDVRLAAKRVVAFLGDLAEATDSQSVSMRVALPTEKAMQPHGLALVEVASYPQEEEGSRLEILTEDQGWFDWICMRTGQPIYVPYVFDRSEYLELRPSTVSELIVPIRLEGTVVGVLNLGSSLFDAYDTVQPLILSFSEAIGRTLADARAELEQSVIDNAAQALNRRHTMESQLDLLEDQIPTLGLGRLERASLADKVSALKVELDAMRRVKPAEEEIPRTLPQILEHAANRVDYLGDLPANILDDRFSFPIPGDRARALEVSISNILSNLMNYTATSLTETGGKPLRGLEMSVCSLGGTESIVLSFQNFADGYIDAQRIADLYRAPIQGGGGRLRVGGLLAGLSARRANARLQATVLSDGRSVRTTLIVPVER